MVAIASILSALAILGSTIVTAAPAPADKNFVGTLEQCGECIKESTLCVEIYLAAKLDKTICKFAKNTLKCDAIRFTGLGENGFTPRGRPSEDEDGMTNVTLVRAKKVRLRQAYGFYIRHPSSPLEQQQQSDIAALPRFAWPRLHESTVALRACNLLIYEVQLKELFEKYPQAPCRERASRCFGILDEILPFIGTLAPIVRTIRDELYQCVYSKDLTSSEKDPFVERVPFFSAVSRIGEARCVAE
ncbi:hypothetical protein BDK51DRAFT_45282 [Blyttiomyces helicus]|uniref:Saposin B-type domain-containing protein n=1 Tax=Blyttiomyces helicus TaxID=388810 RepID=A0A4P9WKW0_9FUNG|nr:hypothetical protein BDK51DRAFT_45282 [Blyttiomyces helicus]|eukprot:RKO91820.1 hypothetical protein BDK51DRAFT_45282 [Blyttiomyces helicus]